MDKITSGVKADGFTTAMSSAANAGKGAFGGIAWSSIGGNIVSGIVNGISATSFAPNRIVTRQEAITIFYRYCVGCTLSDVDSGVELTGFADRNHVAEYAADAFTWAVATGLVEGSPAGGSMYLNPGINLNRAQAAVLLQRCVENIIG
jgi:hypothetical protein